MCASAFLLCYERCLALYIELEPTFWLDILESTVYICGLWIIVVRGKLDGQMNAKMSKTSHYLHVVPLYLSYTCVSHPSLSHLTSFFTRKDDWISFVLILGCQVQT